VSVCSAYTCLLRTALLQLPKPILLLCVMLPCEPGCAAFCLTCGGAVGALCRGPPSGGVFPGQLQALLPGPCALPPVAGCPVGCTHTHTHTHCCREGRADMMGAGGPALRCHQSVGRMCGSLPSPPWWVQVCPLLLPCWVGRVGLTGAYRQGVDRLADVLLICCAAAVEGVQPLPAVAGYMARLRGVHGEGAVQPAIPAGGPCHTACNVVHHCNKATASTPPVDVPHVALGCW
jgi:hypothetical protein